MTESDAAPFAPAETGDTGALAPTPPPTTPPTAPPPTTDAPTAPKTPTSSAAAPEPSTPTPWRFWPDTFAVRLVLVACAGATLTYVIAVLNKRYAGIFDPWSFDGDQPQAVWHYWRYVVDGAFPPGDFQTDYAFVMHAPPVWWALMATLSKIVASPLVAAKALNIAAAFATCIAIFVAASKRANAFVGLGAVLLLMRSVDFTSITAGGYARSFGPFLLYLFLAAFMTRRHLLVLAILVLQAAFYPSVVMPCGLAYGLFTVVAGPTMGDRLRRMAGMFVAGLLIIALGKFQDIEAPAWWGPLVTVKEAEQMPSWKAGGRIAEVPLRPIADEVPRNILRPFMSDPSAPLASVGRIVSSHPLGCLAAAAVVLVAMGVAFVVIRRRGRRIADPFPWEIPLVGAAAFVAYLVARELAFKLYLPYRPLQHVWPYTVYLGLPLFAWTLARNALPRRLHVATATTLATSVLPMFLLFGHGLVQGPKTYDATGRRGPFYEYIRTLPVDAVLAGEFALVDKTPLLAWHQSYMTRNLAHPFRAGYYAEAERRIIAMYSALYAGSFDDVLAFCQKEKVDYLVYRPAALADFDKQIFIGPRDAVMRVYRANKPRGFALQHPPDSVVIYRFQNIVVVSVAKLAAAVAAGEIAPAAPAVGPRTEDGRAPTAAPAASDGSPTPVPPSDDAVDGDASP